MLNCRNACFKGTDTQFVFNSNGQRKDGKTELCK